MPAKLMPPTPLKPFVERAFEMAQSGRFATLEAIERALYEEGYSRGSPHWNSVTLRRQLRETCRKATGTAA